MRRALTCLILLHSLDHQDLLIESTAITVIQDVRRYHDHVHSTANAIVYTMGRKHAVTETEQEVAVRIRACGSTIR